MKPLRSRGVFADESREFYISEIIGKNIYDNYGHKVGKVRDLAAVWKNESPQIMGIKFTHATEIIPIDRVAEFSRQGVYLLERPKLTMVRPIMDEEIYVNRWLVDKQVVDTKGAKVVRVNDIKLRWERKAGDLVVYLVSVDIGMRGLVRRLGLGNLCNAFSEQLLEWQHFRPLETRTAHLRLAISQEDLAHLHPADIADILEDLDRKEQEDLLGNLNLETAAETLAEVNSGTRTRLLENMDSAKVSALVQAMGPDEAADVLGDLSHDKSSEVLDLMGLDDAEEIRELMEYEEGTAGSMMTTELVTLPVSQTAQQAIDHLRTMAPSVETIYYLYVVDEEDRLLGVLSLRELIIAPPETPLSMILHRNVVTVDPEDNFDTVLETALKYDFLALPVAEQDGQIIGIITVDDILGTLFSDRENRRNAQKYSYLMFRRTFGRK